MTRETRLLLATIGVSLSVLLVLARFRFPAREAPEPSPSPAPLARLATRPAYDELAAAVGSLDSRVSGSLTTLAVAAGDGAPTHSVPALRVRDDLVLARLDGTARLAAHAKEAGGPAIVARDRVRRVALVRVVKQPAPVLAAGALLTPGLEPRYFAVAEATAAGPALRPVFVGRVDRVRDPVWSAELAALGGTGAIAAGAFLFALDGQFAGMVADGHDGPVVVPPDVVFALANDLASHADTPPVDLGVAVQPLTPVLSRAVGMEHGVVVSAVAAGSPADGRLKPADGIRAVDGTEVESVQAFDDRLARRAPGEMVRLTVVRRGTTVDVELVARDAPEPPAPASDGESPISLGAVLRTHPPLGSEVVSVQPASPAAEAGLRAGDLVTGVDATAAPAPGPIARAFTQAEPGGTLLFFVRRGSSPVVLAVEKP